ncbi:MAG: hypothetical protein IPM06_19910 [Rhizobiales bacterium]|nr:hypothetical protein [Hyphomicrobiales bacterium]
MVHYFTADEWPTVQQTLQQAGITNYVRLRMDLTDPSAGWQPTANVDMQVLSSNNNIVIVYGLAKFMVTV